MRHMLYILDYDTGEAVTKLEGTEQECAKALCEFMCVEEISPESFVGRFRFTRWGNRYAGEICPVEPDELEYEEGTLISLLDDEE